MTRNTWNTWFQNFFGTNAFAHKVWKNNPWLKELNGSWDILLDDLVFTTPQKEFLMNTPAPFNLTATQIDERKSSLASLQPATCTAWTQQYYEDCCNPPGLSIGSILCGAQEGNNPMFTQTYNKTPAGDLTINLAPAASASMSTKSDTAIQRDYLMAQFKDIHRSFDYGDLHYNLRKQFNLDVNNAPKTSQELIDAIKGGKYKLDDRIMKFQAAGQDYDDADEEYVGGVFSAFTWDGPMPDRDGFDAAKETFRKMLKDTERTIIVKSPDEGLAAIQALEAWTPTGKSN